MLLVVVELLADRGVQSNDADESQSERILRQYVCRRIHSIDFPHRGDRQSVDSLEIRRTTKFRSARPTDVRL